MKTTPSNSLFKCFRVFATILTAAIGSLCAEDIAVLSKNSPNLNSGRIEGDVAVIDPENVNVNAGHTIQGTLHVPGNPTINGSTQIIQGSGSTEPSSHTIGIHNKSTVDTVEVKTEVRVLPVVTQPADSSGTVDAVLSVGGSLGDPAQLRDLVLQSGYGSLSLPAGNYGDITIKKDSTLVLGVAGQVSEYVFTSLTLQKGAGLEVLGSVQITLRKDLHLNGAVAGDESHPEWLTLSLFGGNAHLNAKSTFYGHIDAALGNVHLNASSQLIGSVRTEMFSINGRSLLRYAPREIVVVNQAPSANSASYEVVEDTSIQLELTGVDPEGQPLTYTITAQPQHGTLSGTAPLLTYTPAAGYAGSDQISFVVSDGVNTSATAVIDLNVLPVNDAPTAESKVYSLDEDTSVNVLLAGSDQEGEALSYTVLTQPLHGQVTGTAPNLVYTPGANFFGQDSFTYKVNDGELDSEIATINLTVDAVNDQPVANAQSLSTAEDQDLTIQLSGSDVEGDALSYTIKTQPLHGILSGAGADWMYTPDADYHGDDSFTFVVNDGSLESEEVQVSITVTPVNDAPVATNASLQLAEDGSVVVTFTGSDVDGDSLSYVPSQPLNGTLVDDNGSWVYTPNANFHGEDSIAFQVADPSGATASGVISLTVTPVNDDPVASSDSFSLNEDTSLQLVFQAVDVDGDSLTYTPAQPQYGTLVNNAGNWVYTPQANYHGTDSISFTVTDGNGGMDTGTLTLTVLPVNDAPLAVAQSVQVNEDESLLIDQLGTDPDGDALTFTASSPAHGTLTVQAGQWLYVPAADYHGADSFSFTVNDGNGGQSSAQVTITVVPVNDDPVAQAQSVETPEDNAVLITLNATDVDGDALSYQVNQPANGTLTQQGENWLYTPNENFYGADSFTFTVTDGNGGSSSAQVNLTVQAVNDAPVASGINVQVDAGSSVMIAPVASDVDGNSLSFSIVDQPDQGSVTVVDGNLVYSVGDDGAGVVYFTYRASDGALSSATAQVRVMINATLSVAIASPTGGATYRVGDEISVQVSAKDIDNKIELIELYAGQRLLGRINGAQGIIAWTADEVGQTQLTAKAWNDSGKTAVSLPVDVVLTGKNTAPVVSAGSDQQISLGDVTKNNLLLNSGCEDDLNAEGDISHWDVVAGSWGRGDASHGASYPAAQSGSFYFRPQSATRCELSQVVDVTAWQQAIDAGTQSFVFEAFLRSKEETARIDVPHAVIEMIGVEGLIQSVSIAPDPVTDTWLHVSETVTLAKGTEHVRIRLLSEHNDSDESNDAFFDSLAFYPAFSVTKTIVGSFVDDGLPTEEKVTWEQISGPHAVIGSPDQLVTSLGFFEQGQYEFKLTVNDGELENSDTLHVTVSSNATNLPPLVDAGEQVSGSFEDQPVSLQGTASDDGLPAGQLETRWFKVSGPGVVDFDNPADLATGVRFQKPGLYKLRLQASDGEYVSTDDLVVNVPCVGASRPLDLVISVDNSESMGDENDPVTARYQAQQASEGFTYQLDPVNDRSEIIDFDSYYFDPNTTDESDTRAAIVNAHKRLNDTFAVRAGAKRAIIVICDGFVSADQTHYPDTMIQAIKETGSEIFIIAMSNGVDQVQTEELKQLATSNGHYYELNQVEEIMQALASIQKSQCGTMNLPPKVYAGVDQNVPNLNESVALNASFIDDGLPTNATFSFVWEVVSGDPAGIQISDASLLSPTVTLTTAGEYTLRLRVSDGLDFGQDTLTLRTQAPCEEEAPSGLVAWWPFENSYRDVIQGIELEGRAWKNSDSNFVDGAIGKAVRFDGSYSNTLRVPADKMAKIVGGSGYTVEAWVKYDVRDTVDRSILGWRRFFNNEDAITYFDYHNQPASYVSPTGGFYTEYFELYLATRNYPYSTWRSVPFHYGHWGAVDPRAKPNITIAPVYHGSGVSLQSWETNYLPDPAYNDYHHLVMSYNGETGRLELYANGVYLGEGATPFSSVDGQTVYLGFSDFDFFGAEFYIGELLQGSIDELALYDRYLSTEEVLGLHATPLAKRCFESMNQAPEIDAGADIVVALSGDPVTLTGTATDDGIPDGLTGRWVPVSGPATPAVEAVDYLTARVTFTQAGEYTFVYRVSDGAKVSEDTLKVTVLEDGVANEAPYVELGEDQVINSTALSLQPVVSDDLITVEDLQYQWNIISAPGTVVFETPYNQKDADIVFSTPGHYTFELVVSDGTLTSRDSVSVHILDSVFGGVNLVPTGYLQAEYHLELPNSNVILAAEIEDDQQELLTYSWSQIAGPAPATFSSSSVMQPTVTATVAGDYVFQLLVSDGEFEVAFHTVLQVHLAGYGPPSVDAGEHVSAQEFTSITLSASSDKSGVSYHWKQLSGPEGVLAEIAGENAAVTQVQLGEEGNYLFEVVVNDGSFQVSDTVMVTVFGEATVEIESPVSGATLTDRRLIPVEVLAKQGGKSVRLVEIILDGVLLGDTYRYPGSDTYRRDLAPLSIGTHTLVARATFDDASTVESAPLSIEILDYDEASLTVELHTPEREEVVRSRYPVTGTVLSDYLSTWSLQVREEEAGSWETVHTSSSPVQDGILAEFDPSLLKNGIYLMRVVATSTLGQFASSEERTIIIDGNLKIGHFSLAFEDMSVALPGVPLSVTRTYDSRDSSVGDFGPGWNMGLNGVKIRKSRDIATGWNHSLVELGAGALGFFYGCLESNDSKLVTVSFPDGRTEVFRVGIQADGTQTSGLIGTLPSNCAYLQPVQSGEIIFTPVNQSLGTLTIEGGSRFVRLDGTNVLDLPSGEPTEFRYTEEDGTSYLISTTFGLKELTDRQGNKVTIQEDGIYHSAGENVLFTRDAANGNRITAVTDPAGNQILYGYDEQDRLASVMNRENEVTTMLYENVAFPNYLTSILDPRGVQAIRTEYDDDGRMIKQVDADGNAIEFEHDLANNREIIRDRLGNVTIHEYDDFGNVIRTTDALGGVTTRAYDAQDNEISVTTPEGVTTSRTFDSKRNVTSETDGLGHVTSYSFNDSSQPTTIVDALGQATTFGYNAATGNMTALTDAVGTTTSFGYSGSNLASLTDANGVVTSFTHDSLGREQGMTVKDAAGNVLRSESYTYDANGNRLTTTTTRTKQDGTVETLVTSFTYDAESRVRVTTLPDGSTTEVIYNSFGKQQKTIDQLQRETLYEYDDRGNLVKTTYHDNTFSTTTYDLENRSVASTNRMGVTTYFVYDALGRMTATILPDDSMPASVLDSVADILASSALADNPRTVTEYDADGRVVASIDALGNRTEFEYDAAGRRTLVRDALGKETLTTYNAVGSQVSVTDALNRTTSFVYDDANRLVQTVFPDASTTSVSYDSLGRRQSVTDQEGNVTSFEYDDLGRMVAVVDAEGFRTEYDYNERGDLLVQRDALGRETSYLYDKLGRRIGRTLPEGQSESVAYNVLGNMTSRTDFNGHTTTYTYNSRDLLEVVTADTSHPSLALAHAPAKFEYGYDSIGRRISATVKGSSNNVLYQDGWSYDLRGRLSQHSSSNGTLDYSYDVNSNLLSAHSNRAGGYDQSYSYDALNRLEKLYQGRDAGRTEIAGYSYNAVGSLANVSYQNGIGHEYFYNSLNRLTGLDVAKNGVAAVQQGYAYTLNKAGHRTKIEEASGRVIDHVFDKLYRLKQESIAGSLDGRNGSIDYVLDAVGNRTSRTASTTSLLELLPDQSFSYTNNDLLSHHSYDANGSTTSSPQADYPVAKDEDGAARAGTNGDIYDFRGKLLRRNRGDGAHVDCLYNADGDRIRKEITNDLGIKVKDDVYLIDRNTHTGYAQVVEEVDVNGLLTARYHYGHDLVAVDRKASAGANATRDFYSYDGHGSVRAITDEYGDLLEEYDYDAFGIMLAFRQWDAGTGMMEDRDVADYAYLSKNRYLYTGEQYDADLGMYYLRARYTNAQTGRFHRMDSYEGRNGEPLTLHKYLYTHANPVSYSDPSGMYSLSELGAVIQMQVKNIERGYNRSKPYLHAAYKVIVTAAVIYNIRATLASDHRVSELTMVKTIQHNVRLLAKFNKRKRFKPKIVSKILKIATFIGRSSIANSVGMREFGLETKVNGLPELSPYVHKDNGSIFMSLTGRRSRDVTKAYRIRRRAKPAKGNWTWHHHELVGLMQLVRSDAHTVYQHHGGVFFYEILNNKIYKPTVKP